MMKASKKDKEEKITELQLLDRKRRCVPNYQHHHHHHHPKKLNQ